MTENKKEVVEKFGYLNKKQLCKVLSISPHTIQKELNEAIRETNGVVIKIGRTLRIDFNKFVEWNSEKNSKRLNDDANFSNEQSGRRKRWKKIKTRKISTNEEEGHIGLITTMEVEKDISSQLRQRIFKKR
jgi:hypothetical protein